MKLLAPPRHRRDECQVDIEYALRRVKGKAAIKVLRSKRGKAGLLRYANALRRARAAYEGLDAIQPWFSLAEIASVVGAPSHIDREIEKAEAFLKRPSSSRASQHKAAVAASYDLLHWWGRRIAVTRGGEWARLAGILADDQDVDLFDLLRAHKRSNGPTMEKVWGGRWVRYWRVRR